jgi:fructose-1,6-bisphosphatase I
MGRPFDAAGECARHCRCENVQGEQQQKLDVIANDVLLGTLGGREGIAIVASEENEEPVMLREDATVERRYCVLFDPLDGSSNLDVCGGVAFMLVERGLRTPTAHKSYSVNEGNRRTFPDGCQRYLDWVQEQSYSSRYVGSMVADVHRILLKGGVFMYPPTKKASKGKVRLMYEANPMAMLMEQAGGKALAAPGERILDVQPTDIHQRVPVIMGSVDEVDHVIARL